MSNARGRFGVGQVICHRLFDYRGAIIDVDPVFQGSDEWYDSMSKTRPPKDEPWYHVLVHEATHRTYVAERNLEPDESHQPISHPEIGDFFSEFRGGRYITLRTVN